MIKHHLLTIDDNRIRTAAFLYDLGQHYLDQDNKGGPFFLQAYKVSPTGVNSILGVEFVDSFTLLLRRGIRSCQPFVFHHYDVEACTSHLGVFIYNLPIKLDR